RADLDRGQSVLYFRSFGDSGASEGVSRWRGGVGDVREPSFFSPHDSDKLFYRPRKSVIGRRAVRRGNDRRPAIFADWTERVESPDDLPRARPHAGFDPRTSTF